MAERRTALDFVRAGNGGDHHRAARLCADFKRSVVERKQRRGVAAVAGSLGIKPDGAHIVFDVIRGGVNGFNGVARTFAVDGQGADSMRKLPDYGKLHIFRLCDKPELKLIQSVKTYERVEHGAVVLY